MVGGINGSAVGTTATDGWALAPDFSERAAWLYLTWAVACFFLLSCVFHLGNALLWKKFYLSALASGYAPFRWIEYTFSASVMILVLGYTSGTSAPAATLRTQGAQTLVCTQTNSERAARRSLVAQMPIPAATLPVLVSLFGFTAITMSFGHLHEVICRPKSLDEWAIPSKLQRLQAHLIGYVPQIFAWSLVIGQFMEAGGSSTTGELTHPPAPRVPLATRWSVRRPVRLVQPRRAPR